MLGLDPLCGLDDFCAVGPVVKFGHGEPALAIHRERLFDDALLVRRKRRGRGGVAGRGHAKA